MKAAILLPADPPPKEILRQQLIALDEHFPDIVEKSFVCSEGTSDLYCSDIPDGHFVTSSNVNLSDRRNIIKVGVLPRFPEKGPVLEAKGQDLWMIDWSGRLVSLQDTEQQSQDDRDRIQRRLQITPRPDVFGKIANSTGQMHYFPNGYTYCYPGMGKTNSLGFRVSDDFSALRERDDNHVLVICVGGSACWSMRCLDTQSFPTVLEKILNERSLGRLDAQKRITVLNFGYLSHLIMNEINCFIMHCLDLRPDIVIAHDGYNDFLFGQLQDTSILESHEFIYHENLEIWAATLHGSHGDYSSQPLDQKITINHAIPIMRAFIRRKREFADIVAARGAKFVWGLQPMWASKNDLSAVERHLVLSLARDHHLASVNVGTMFDYMSSHFTPRPDENFVNFHKLFQAYGNECFLITDHVHLSPEGDRIVADHYAKILDKLIWPSEHDF